MLASYTSAINDPANALTQLRYATPSRSTSDDSRIGRSRIGWTVWCTMSGRSGSYYLTLDAMTGPMLVRGE